MSDQNLSVSDVKDLMSAMHKNRIGSLRLTRNGFSLELEAIEPVSVSDAVFPVPETAARTEDYEPDMPEGTIVSAPIVGVFYTSPAPDKDPFVTVGSSVKKGDVLFIIESMKLMNEVQSERDGVVREILVENAQGVEFGQPILRLE